MDNTNERLIQKYIDRLAQVEFDNINLKLQIEDLQEELSDRDRNNVDENIAKEEEEDE